MSDKDFIEAAEGFIAEGDTAEAVAVLQRALVAMPAAWSPTKEDARFLQIAFWDREEFFAHVRFYGNPSKSVAWVNRSYSKAHYMLSAIASKQGHLQEALEYNDRGLRLEADHPDLWCQKGVIFGKLKRHTESFDCYRRAATVRAWATKSQIARALRGQGVQLVDLNRLDEAEDVLRRSLELEPDSDVAKKELEYIAQQREGTPAEPPVPWFVDALLNPPKDPLTKGLIAEVENLPPVPEPKTVGSENYSRISRQFLSHGWDGFEKEFDRIVPRSRPDYEPVKRDLLREPLLSLRAHKNMVRAFAAASGVSDESLDRVFDEIFDAQDESAAS